jgi:hypothetical protein
LTYEKKPLWYWITQSFSTTQKKKEVSGEEEGSRLDLIPSLDNESH